MKLLRPLTLFIIIFLGEIGLFLLFSSFYNPSLASQYGGLTVVYNNLVYEPYFIVLFSIFLHNLSVATLDFIPLFGLAMLVFSIIETGLVVAINGSIVGTPGLTISLYLFTLPHSWLELPAYAVASASGIYFIFDASSNGLRKATIRLFYMYLMVAVELLIAASFEAGEIVDKSYGLLPYLYWIPAIPAFYFLIVFYKYFQRLADSS
ncbi:stage II sporulation protein M [Stygiolobus caldivivus]|uniref:Stage II sporulation protein M n=1 Tax=Stygiolobus caldivivus TaxID=2824673 RepID=A0A8D5U9C1_9CREN|nr:stage II sporulation protein M [Stygiolobus caldivivus]BCU71079.1 hypothetical protein KN1_23760 [Stygiolobus caldivivus]